MFSGTLPISERHPRPLTGTAGTMVAVLLLLAILPSAAAVKSPMSAAILESTLRDARVIHVQRERPNPSREGSARGDSGRATWGATFGPVSPAQMTETDVPLVRVSGRASGVVIESGNRVSGIRLLAMARCGQACLPPPVGA